LGRAHPAYYLSLSHSLVPFPLTKVIGFSPQFSQPEASPAWLAPDRLVVREGLESLSGQTEATFAGGS